MKDAVKRALTTPFFLSFPVAIFTGLVVILAMIVLSYRALNLDDIRSDLKAAIRERQAIERHLEAVDKRAVKVQDDMKEIKDMIP